MLGRLIRSLTFAAIGLALLPRPALACTCQVRKPKDAADYRQWLENHDGVVFRGTVTALEKVADGNSRVPGVWRVTFNVERQWKGVTNPTITIYTAVDGGLCGITFNKGGRYLVAADHGDFFRDGRLFTYICRTGWFYVREPERFVAALGEGTVVSN